VGAFAPVTVCAADQPSAATLAKSLREASFDREQTYRVRDLQIRRGDITIYLSEGTLSFIAPVGGHTIGALFSTLGAEAGDAEILVLPPARSERASLASFINAPNLDEHFGSALFLFSDDTAKDVLDQIASRPLHKAPEFIERIPPASAHLLSDVSPQIRLRLLESLLDAHDTAQGFFYTIVAGREHGSFEAMYDPSDFEPVHVGRAAQSQSGEMRYELWTSFRPRRIGAFVPPAPNISSYVIDVTIHPDLALSATAQFRVTAKRGCGRVMRFGLSDRLTLASATVNGRGVETYQRDHDSVAEPTQGAFLLVSDAPFEAGKQYDVEVQYGGSVIRETRDGQYFVDERNFWYPYTVPTLATFDLTFRCPENLRLVSTGELIDEQVAHGVRVVHRRTELAEHLAGFNLGEYTTSTEDRGGYRIDCYANRNAEPATPPLELPRKPLSPVLPDPMPAPEDIPGETARILEDYTRRWGRLPIHSMAVSPIPAYLGQGFPGLIYLSSVSYLREEDRPLQLRNPRMDAFFSEMLLPHEIAHQWWGNVVTVADYRADWLMEALANYSALQYLEKSRGAAAVHAVMEEYRSDLSHEVNGKTIESAGPVDFSMRLETNAGTLARHVIVYEKGTWILHMLRERLGSDAFLQLQTRLLHDFAAKPISNDEFRAAAAAFLPARDSDKGLETFFETWVYGTGIPTVRMDRRGRDYSIDVSGVDEDFTVDVPLRCSTKDGRHETRRVRVTSGSTPVSMPGSLSACQLPSTTEFLYTP